MKILIAPLASLSAAAFKVGARVVVKAGRDEWYTGTVTRSASKIKIEFDDGNDALVGPEDFKDVRALVKPKKLRRALTGAEAKLLYTVPKESPVRAPKGKVAEDGAVPTSADFAATPAISGKVQEKAMLLWTLKGEEAKLTSLIVSGGDETKIAKLRKAIKGTVGLLKKVTKWVDTPTTKKEPRGLKRRPSTIIPKVVIKLPTHPKNVGIDPNRKGKQVSTELYLQCGNAEAFAYAMTKGDDVKMAYVHTAYDNANKAIFKNAMRRPRIYFLKNQQVSSFRGRGIWKARSRELGLTLRLFIAGEAHVLNTLIHEMCHQAVTDIDKTVDRTQGGHGHNWVEWMRRAGIPPSRYDMTDATEYMDQDEKNLKTEQDTAKANAFKGKIALNYPRFAQPCQFYSTREMKWFRGVFLGTSSGKGLFIISPNATSWTILPKNGVGWLYEIPLPERTQYETEAWKAGATRTLESIGQTKQLRADRRASKKYLRNTYGY